MISDTLYKFAISTKLFLIFKLSNVPKFVGKPTYEKSPSISFKKTKTITKETLNIECGGFTYNRNTVGARGQSYLAYVARTRTGCLAALTLEPEKKVVETRGSHNCKRNYIIYNII